MRSFYRLFNYEFSSMAGLATILWLAALFLPSLLLHYEIRHYSEHSTIQRFEAVLMSSGGVYLSLFFLAALSGLFIKSIYAGYWGSKNIYTFLTLPTRREAIYCSKLLALISCMLMLLAAQLAGTLLAYSLYSSKVGAIAEGQYLMNNGLFLAFIRSEFLRIIMPLTLKGIVSTASMAIAFATGLYYALLCERSSRYWGYLLVAATGWLMIHVIGERTTVPNSYYPPGNMYLDSIFLLAFSGFFIWQGIRLVKSGAIV